MKKSLLALVIAMFFNLSSFSQSSLLEKVEEFGAVNSEDLEARLDALTNVSRENSTKIIRAAVYRDIIRPMGFAHRFGAVIVAYAKYRGIANGKFSYEDCGIEETRRTSFYLAPERNTESLCINNEKTSFDKSFLFDSFADGEDCYSCCMVDCFDKETSSASFSAFAQILKKHPESKGYVLISWQKRFSKRKNIKTKYWKELKNLFVKNELPLSRIVFVNKEQREFNRYVARNIELWFVAPNGFIPSKD